MRGRARPERQFFNDLGRFATKTGGPASRPRLRTRALHARDPGVLGPVLRRLGSLEVRLATTAKEVRRVQRLRFKAFYKEMSAIPRGAAAVLRHDIDEYDALCDHLPVLDYDVDAETLPGSKAQGGRHLSPAATGGGRTAISGSTPRGSITSRR